MIPSAATSLLRHAPPPASPLEVPAKRRAKTVPEVHGTTVVRVCTRIEPTGIARLSLRDRQAGRSFSGCPPCSARGGNLLMRRFGLALAVLVTACGSSDGSPFGGGGGGGSSAGGVDAGVSGGSTSASGGSPSSGGVTTSSGGTQQAGGTGSGGTTTSTGGTLDLDASPGGPEAAIPTHRRVESRPREAASDRREARQDPAA